MKKLFRGIISAALCLAIFSSTITVSASTNEDASGTTETGGAETSQNAPVYAESKIYLQDDMRAVFVTPSVDFDSESTSKKQLNQAHFTLQDQKKTTS